MIGGVYKILNVVTNKVYIGSSIDIKRRCKTHLRDLNHGNHDSNKLQRSYNKHGVHKFIFDIIEVVEHNYDLLNREQFYIGYYDSYNTGYNCAPVAGSRLGQKASEKTKLLMSELKKGTKNGMYGKEPWNKGKTNIYSKESLENRSKNLKGKTPWNKGCGNCNNTNKKIKQLTKEGVLIKEWPSIKSCADALNIKPKMISRVLYKQRNFTSGFKFEYV